MLFLACESARKSVRDLIEFEPNNAENGITILLCELPCWRFLVDNFPCTDVRHKRLLLRQARYKEVIPKFIDDVRIAVKKAEKRAAEMAEAKARGETGSKSADRLANREEVYRDWKKAGEMLEDLEKAFADAMAVLPNKEPAPA
jgi:hypothetical protein